MSKNKRQKKIPMFLLLPNLINPFVAQDKKKEQFSNIPDLSGQNLSQQEQEEVINQIAKTQKRFKYDLKNYQVGDIFLWWEIEEITPVYIRFKDEDYSYNLRFLED